jgi:hypothetical protein
MTAEREKAVQLLKEFHTILNFKDSNYSFDDTIKAKNCIKFTIDEIILACEYNDCDSWNTNWWNKVKSEIDLLPEYIEELE